MTKKLFGEIPEIANGPSLQLHSGFFPANRHGKKKIFPRFAYHQHAIKTGGFSHGEIGG